MSVVIPLVVKCRCGCNALCKPTKRYLPGHDLRAALRCILKHYGSIEAFIDEHEEDYEEEV